MTIYSYSRLKCYEQCPRKYKFQYIDKIKIEARENVELFLGKRVHETLKKLYRDLQYQKENTLGELLDYLHYMWSKNWNDSIVIVKKKYCQEDYQNTASKYITDYYHRCKPFNHGRTIALDERIFINLNGSNGYKMIGYSDRLVKNDDSCYEIHDYKTSSRFPFGNKIYNEKQLALYSIGVKERYYDVKDIDLIWHYLKFNKEIKSSWTDEEIKKLKYNITRLIDSIETTKVFPVYHSKLCYWCRFKDICG